MLFDCELHFDLYACLQSIPPELSFLCLSGGHMGELSCETILNYIFGWIFLFVCSLTM